MNTVSLSRAFLDCIMSLSKKANLRIKVLFGI